MINIIEINGLLKKYPNFTMDIPHICIPLGGVVGLIGENGAGKTTLISMLLNQVSRDGGSITIFGKDNISSESMIKEKVGFVVDECCFHPCLSPKDINIIMRSVYKEWDEAQFFTLLEKYSLRTKSEVSMLSKGNKTRLMMAVALSYNPDLLILDEVTSGLDPVVRDEILTDLRNIVRNGDKTVLFSTHITSDLDKIADYVAFIHGGRLVFFKENNELKRDGKELEDIMLSHIKGLEVMQ